MFAITVLNLLSTDLVQLQSKEDSTVAGFEPTRALPIRIAAIHLKPLGHTVFLAELELHLAWFHIRYFQEVSADSPSGERSCTAAEDVAGSYDMLLEGLFDDLLLHCFHFLQRFDLVNL